MGVRRALPDPTLPAIGPVIFLDHVGPVALPAGTEKTVPPHPHAGIETLAYLLSGSATHRDSAGNASTAVAGEAQWMRAGRGIVHAESVSGGAAAGVLIYLVHIWINLPRGHKHATPAYRAFCTADIPTLKFGAAQVQLLAGNWAGAAARWRPSPIR